ncbi:retroviral-like aspartic protease family protein [Sulfitobacter faviae]|uniref:retroviral-like aspartic protease family protein n=1 Tax=Sulfitobacter faviae TaxID=1775881 RepID=UPI003B434AC2
MPTLYYTRTNRLPIIDVTVRYHPLNGVAHSSGEIPEARVRALIDTGATHVVLQPKIVRALDLPFAANIDNTVVGGAVHNVPCHAGDVIFGDDPTYTVTDVLILSQAVSGYEMIIGWDVLRFTKWSFEPTESFSQSW